jgi:lariat debranching enzyme
MADFVPSHRGRGRGRGHEGGRFGGRNSGRHPRGRQGRGGGRGRGGSSHNGNGPNNNKNHSTDWKDPIEELGDKTSDSIAFAIQGCCHGELDAIYERVAKHEELTGNKVDVLLCCGDFQSLRNTADFHSLAVPPKYRDIGSFWKYYAGIAKAPVLTIFIGGNHEASQPLSELHYGGWVAPNIYYLGAAGVVRVGGVRIGGLSGICKSHDYLQGRFERPPYDKSSIRSVYHVRNLDVFRMKCLSNVDIMLSHDWPQGIEQHGNTQALLRQKPFFREEIQRNDLGSLPNWEVLQKLKPKWWFAAHLHVKFAAQVHHAKATSNDGITSLVPSQVGPTHAPTSDETNDKDSTGELMTQFRSLESNKTCDNTEDLTDQMTRFLSLDKCLPRRQYLSIVHVTGSSATPKLEYDVEWLAVLKKTHHLTVSERRRVYIPDELVTVTNDDVEWIRTRFEGSFEIPNDFATTVSPFTPGEAVRPPLSRMGNPQTDRLLQKLDLQHIITVPYHQEQDVVDENEIDLEDDEEDDSTNADMNSAPPPLSEQDVQLQGEPVLDESASKKARLEGVHSKDQ